MINGIRIRHLSYSGRRMLALAARCTLAILDQAHDRLVGPGAACSIFRSLRSALLNALTKLSDATRQTKLDRTHFVVYVAVLRAALQAAQKLGERRAAEDLRLLLDHLPRHKSSRPALDHAAGYITWLVLTRNRLLARTIMDHAFDRSTSAAA